MIEVTLTRVIQNPAYSFAAVIPLPLKRKGLFFAMRCLVSVKFFYCRSKTNTPSLRLLTNQLKVFIILYDYIYS